MNWIEQAVNEARETGVLELEQSFSTFRTGPPPPLPPEIFQMRGLRVLRLTNLDLEAFPDALGDLSQLEEFELFQFKPVTLPRSIERLGNLKKLRLMAQLSSVPFGLGAFQRLEELDLAWNKLTEFPAGLRDLKHLTALRIDDQQNLSLLADLHSVRDLSVHRLKSAQSPLTFVRGLELRALSLRGAVVTREDVELLCGMPLLEDLSVDVDVFPRELARLPRLQSLALRVKGALPIPEAIAEFRTLRKLSVESQNYDYPPNPDRLEASPVSRHLLSLRGLTDLKLDSAGLGSIAGRLAQLDSLKRLALIGCGVAEWEPIVEASSRLEYLNLAHNRLSGLPAALSRATALKTLWLYDTPIDRVPEEIGSLANLEELSLGRAGLTEFPSPILELKALQQLYLQDNALQELPSELAQLTKLKELNLSNNTLRRLPRAMGLLHRLRDLSVQDNKDLEYPPPEIVAQGAFGIQNYFSAIAEAPAERLYEAKLLIVGEGGVGKTYLAARLLEPRRNLVGSQMPIRSTEGIEIRTWEEPTKLTPRFRINLWDFGGQEIYHATHQFFLTKRSLYLFVWDARKEDRTGGFDYWLNVIRLLSAGSPVIVVLNKADERVREIDEADLRTHFRNIQEFHKVSALTGMGIEALRQRVVATATTLPHVGDEWPATWSAVRRSLERDPRDYISREEYEAICEAERVATSHVGSLAAYLHDLGVILHFPDDPVLQRIVILKPEWGTNAVYRVLDTRAVQDAKGRFSLKDLNQIWTGSTYPPSRHPDLLQLMIKFELCFPLGVSGVYVAPELLSAEAPQFEWNDANNLLFQYHYSFMPAGIMTRFIARMHTWIEGDKFWRNGVILARRTTRALIVSEPFNRRIRVELTGTHRRELLSVIRHQIDEIHGTLNDPAVTEMVPCNCRQCRGGSPHLFAYRTLEAYMSKRIDEIRCDKSLDNVPIHALLDEVMESRPRTDLMPDMRPTYAIEHVEHLYINSEADMRTAKPTSRPATNPWVSGSFYLFGLVAILATLMVSGRVLSPWWLPVTIVGGLLLITVIGALQLRNDERLQEQRFLQLMKLAFHQIPLLGKLTPRPSEITSGNEATSGGQRHE